jgi:hypothetical protein
MFPFGDQCLTPPSVHHTPTSWLSTRTSSQDSRGTSHLTWYPVQVPACACLWTPPSLSRQGCSFRKQVANYSLLVGSLRSDEHSLGPSTINQIPCGRSESATGTGTRIESKGGFQRDSEVPSLNATFLLQDRSSQPLLLFLLYHNALGLAFTLLKEHEYIIIHTKEQVIVYELPAFPATKPIFIRKLNFILAPI